MNGTSSRWVAASGALYVVAVSVGSALMENGSAAVAGAAMVLVLLSFMALVVFVGWLHTVLRRADGPGGWLAPAALVAGALHAASRFDLLASELGTNAAPQGAADTLGPLNDYGFLVTGLLLGVYAVLVSAACISHRLLLSPLGWFGVGAGAATVLVDCAAVVDLAWWSPWPLVGTGVWLLCLSVLLAVRPVRSADEPVQADLAGAV